MLFLNSRVLGLRLFSLLDMRYLNALHQRQVQQFLIHALRNHVAQNSRGLKLRLGYELNARFPLRLLEFLSEVN